MRNIINLSSIYGLSGKWDHPRTEYEFNWLEETKLNVDIKQRERRS